jgi:glutathionylspermidine synthase
MERNHGTNMDLRVLSKRKDCISKIIYGREGTNAPIMANLRRENHLSSTSHAQENHLLKLW